MPLWLLYALLSTLFAGLTAVLAKYGISKIDSDFGLAIRTSVVFIMVWFNLFFLRNIKEWHLLTPKTLCFLALSGLTTSLSWIFYYRAIKLGTVSYVAAIDKGSVIITILLAFVLLKEPMSAKLLTGAGLMLAGMLVLIWK
jgi:transporter family protein